MKWIFCLLAVSGCFVPASDIGLTCTLVKSGPDGGAVPIGSHEPEIAFAANKDIISFGGTDCSTRVCVRDARYQTERGDPLARGYCSSTCGRCPSGMSCRALLLDEETLMRLQAADPERYKALFGEATRPYFCARE